MTKAELRQNKILDFMKKEVADKGYPPTVREICNALNIRSTSTVHKDLEVLRRLGYIKKDPAKPRALVILDKSDNNEKPSQFTSDNVSKANANINNVTKVEEEVVSIPLLGNIAAGTPILADNNINDTFPVPARFLNQGNNFMLKVRGDSMIEAGIFHGDYILVKETQHANNGDIVVAIIESFESEATVKTFYREDDGRIRLQPENPNMNPMIFDYIQIAGIVTGVFRFF